ncbi:serine/threonine protein kinase [Mycolicibacterium celeriflavum]|nr:serine/threonine protein kinase [Mycolicibacterium celeriflavum]
MVLSVGSVMAGYRIEAVLGAGGMGTVYKARNPTLPRSDALKVLSEQLSQDPHFRARFEREAELAATLDHPNIVTVYSRGETDGQLWIAMQYVAGSDADKELSQGRMTPARAVHIVGEVAKALDYAHRRHLLHRDVKPANFLLAPNDERVFLADFGIARALDEAVGLTQTGMVMASVSYAAPESLAGEGADHRADIYSLGCSLFRMLTGTSPFSRSGGMAAVAAAHLTEPPPRPTDVAPGLPAAMDAVIARAMAKNPNERYQSAGELAVAAARALDETTDAVRATPAPFAGAPPWPSEQTPPPRPPHHTGPPMPGAYGGPAWPGHRGPTTAGYAPTPPIAARPASRSRLAGRRKWVLIAVAAVVVLAAAIGVGTLVSRDDSAPSYTAQTLVHQHGETQLTAQPGAVAAVGPGDADAVLSLGVQPVAMVVPGGTLPSWLKQMVNDNVRTLAEADAAVIAAAEPDLIIDTGEMDDAAYKALAAVAPTVTRPQNTTEWTWQTHLEWIGRMLGRSDEAKKLLDEAAAQQAELRSQHPAFDAKSVEVVTVADEGVTVATADSPAGRYLRGLGFRYPAEFDPASAGAAFRPVANPEELNTTPTDVRVVVRTDKGAGGGSYNGLPQAFSSYRGTTVIVDDPDVIAALNTPGYAATKFLDTTLVDALARQVR